MSPGHPHLKKALRPLYYSMRMVDRAQQDACTADEASELRRLRNELSTAWLRVVEIGRGKATNGGGQ
jgi:hypothetical protein